MFGNVLCVISRCTFIRIVLSCLGTTNDRDIGVVMFTRCPPPSHQIRPIQLQRGKISVLYGFERNGGLFSATDICEHNVHLPSWSEKKRIARRVIV